MRFRVTMQALLDAWTYLSKVVVARALYDGVEITAEGDTLTLVHSDLEVGVRVSIPNVEISEEGKAFFQLKSLMDSMRDFKKDSLIEISTKVDAVNPAKVLVYSKLEGGASGTINGQTKNPNDLFEMVNDVPLQEFVVSQRLLKRGISNTLFALSSGIKPQNAALNAVFVEIGQGTIRFLGTSLNHFATYAFTHQDTGDIETQLKIPQRSASILESVLKELADSEAKIFFNKGLLRVETEDFSFVTRQKDDEYPDFKNMYISKENAKEVIVPRSLLHEGASYANNYVGQKGVAGVITVKDNMIYLAVDDGMSKAHYSTHCTMMFEGEYTIGCRFDTVITACSHIESQDVNILFPEIPGQPAYFYPTQNSEENVSFEQILATNATQPNVTALPPEEKPTEQE